MKDLVKRAFDIVVAGVCLIVLAPVWLAIAIAVRLRLGGPVLFRQERLGLNGRPFTLLKFRTMTDARGPDGELLEDDERLTALGSSLRRTTLDELPEILNVLRSDMSVVGPRPLLPQYRSRYTPEQWRRHKVKPGMAGPVAAYGRNSLSWEEKFRLDVDYVDNHSFWTDLKILGRSALAVVRREGISAEGHATMPTFLGGPDGDTKGPNQ
jgi:lipopolysaccharide/colanic/teichoic acid biosynthesis glycosyltransferase